MPAFERILIISQDDGFDPDLFKKITRNHDQWNNCLIDYHDCLNDGLKELSVSTFQLIIVDCSTFEESALEILIKIRAENHQTPIILLNEPGLEKIAIACLKNGANHYLIKDHEWTHEFPLVLETVMYEFKQNQQLKEQLFALKNSNIKLKKKAILDKETQFYSAKHFYSLLERELRRAIRHHFDLSCLVIDVTSQEEQMNFSGDETEISDSQQNTPSSPWDLSAHHDLFERISLYFKSLVRSSDVWARLSDNRFAAILPHTSLQEAKNAVNRICAEVAGPHFHPSSDNQPIKLRWGLAHYDENRVSSVYEFIAIAERNMMSNESMPLN